MEPLAVEKVTESGGSWQCSVTVGAAGDTNRYTVTVDRSHWEQLTGGRVEAGVLVEKSFVFLLQRESKNSILRTFNLRVISRYFPEYETEIKKLL